MTTDPAEEPVREANDESSTSRYKSIEVRDCEYFKSIAGVWSEVYVVTDDDTVKLGVCAKTFRVVTDKQQCVVDESD